MINGDNIGIISSWPQPVQAFLLDTFGEPAKAEPLGGMSGAGVARLRFAETSVIVKADAGGNEAFFYRSVAPILAKRGIATPHCFWAETVTGGVWLVLEDIRQPLPRERWLADPAVVGMLRRLHQTPVSDLPLSPAQFRPSWPGGMTEAALSLLPPADAEAVEPKLAAIRDAARPLFAPVGFISGDPNPANWGVRATGEPVLFDWERFGLGAPGIDLAITVPGLGNREVYRRVAASYLEGGEKVDKLARAIARAKVWTIVELLAGTATGNAHPPLETVDWLVDQLPGWLDEVE